MTHSLMPMTLPTTSVLMLSDEYDAMTELWEVMVNNVSNVEDETVVMVADEDVIYLCLWGSGLYFGYYY